METEMQHEALDKWLNTSEDLVAYRIVQQLLLSNCSGSKVIFCSGRI
jgi:hypothetical protein